MYTVMQPKNQSYSQKLLQSLALLSVLWTTQAIADDNYQRVNFEVSASTEVANDEVYATLVKTATAKDAKALAEAINPTINQALNISQKYPTVAVSTGRQYAHPSYDSEGVVTGMTASASLQLKSQDIDSVSALITELQSLLVVENISFGVSETLKEQTESRLMIEATQKFKQQATAITQAWGAGNYRLVNAQMNTQGGYARAEFAAAAAMDAASAKQMLQAGSSDVRYTINGVIELQPK